MTYVLRSYQKVSIAVAPLTKSLYDFQNGFRIIAEKELVILAHLVML